MCIKTTLQPSDSQHFTIHSSNVTFGFFSYIPAPSLPEILQLKCISFTKHNGLVYNKIKKNNIYQMVGNQQTPKDRSLDTNPYDRVH